MQKLHFGMTGEEFFLKLLLNIYGSSFLENVFCGVTGKVKVKLKVIFASSHTNEFPQLNYGKGPPCAQACILVSVEQTHFIFQSSIFLVIFLLLLNKYILLVIHKYKHSWLLNPH